MSLSLFECSAVSWPPFLICLIHQRCLPPPLPCLSISLAHSPNSPFLRLSPPSLSGVLTDCCQCFLLHFVVAFFKISFEPGKWHGSSVGKVGLVLLSRLKYLNSYWIWFKYPWCPEDECSGLGSPPCLSSSTMS